MNPASSHQNAKNTNDSRLSPAGRHGHDELNLAEFPLGLLSKRPQEGTHTIEYQDYDRHPRTGVPILRKVTISGAGKYGLPTSHDEEVLMALIYLTLDNKSVSGLNDSTVHFTRRQLLQILGWPDTGTYYTRLKQSMRRWKGLTIVYENWWDHLANEFIPELGFNLLDNYKFIDGRRTEQTQLALPLEDSQPPQRMLCYIKWNETIFASFKNGSLTKLDLDKFFGLPTAAAKRAYRYLNVRLPASGHKDFDLKAFACQHVGFSTNYKPSRLRSEVQETIVQPLEKNDFIEPMPSKNRFLKRNGRDHIVFARKAPPALPPSQPDHATPTLEAPIPSQPSPLIRELTRRGLGGKLAAQFVAEHPADYIEQKIDYFDFTLTIESIKRPGGWLRKAVEDDYGPPPGFIPRAERERLQRAAEEARLRQQQEQEAKREEEAREKAERVEAEAYLRSLPPEEQERLEAAALAAGGEEAQRTYDTMKQFAGGGSGYLRMLLIGYVRGILKNQKVEA